MIMSPVKSSNLEAVGYDATANVLHVKFKSGETFAYHGVSPGLHQSLVNSKSAGAYFHTHIRAGFKGQKVP